MVVVLAVLTHLEQVSKIHEKLMKPDVIPDDVVGDVPDQGHSEATSGLGPESAPLPMAARVMAAIATRSRPEPE
jgi:hypothetical protein